MAAMKALGDKRGGAMRVSEEKEKKSKKGRG